MFTSHRQKKHQYFYLCVMIFLLGILSGCGMFSTQSKEEALEKMQWSYGSDDIQITVHPEPDLNWWGDQPHTLLMTVVQMEDLSAMEAYNSSSQIMSQLLLAETAPTGLLNLKRFFIEPGIKRGLQLARVDKSRYVAIVLGYQHLDPARSIRLYQIGADFDRKGWVFRQYSAKPEPLAIHLQLGAEGIVASASGRQSKPHLIRPTSGQIDLLHNE